MNQQEALVKLATVRLAINHVLRNRAMQKQAAVPILLPPPQVFPEKYPEYNPYVDFNLRRDILATKARIKRMEASQNPMEVNRNKAWEQPHHNVTPSTTPSVPPVQPNAVPLPSGTLQPGGLFPFR